MVFQEHWDIHFVKFRRQNKLRQGKQIHIWQFDCEVKYLGEMMYSAFFWLFLFLAPFLTTFFGSSCHLRDCFVVVVVVVMDSTRPRNEICKYHPPKYWCIDHVAQAWPRRCCNTLVLRLSMFSGYNAKQQQIACQFFVVVFCSGLPAQRQSPWRTRKVSFCTQCKWTGFHPFEVVADNRILFWLVHCVWHRFWSVKIFLWHQICNGLEMYVPTDASCFLTLFDFECGPKKKSCVENFLHPDKNDKIVKKKKIVHIEKNRLFYLDGTLCSCCSALSHLIFYW